MNGFIGPEFNDPVTLCKKSEVVSNPDKIPGTIASAALADDNAAGTDLLPARCFHAQAFRIGISSVSCASLTFSMRHNVLLKDD